MIEKFKTNAEVIENGDKYLYGNHVRMPLSIERGEGAYVFDKDGNKYLDFIGGIAVNGLGRDRQVPRGALQDDPALLQLLLQ
jgi:acetylornithine/N-succinyldiaminopimelate aminotransferase